MEDRILLVDASTSRRQTMPLTTLTQWQPFPQLCPCNPLQLTNTISTGHIVPLKELPLFRTKYLYPARPPVAMALTNRKLIQRLQLASMAGINRIIFPLRARIIIKVRPLRSSPQVLNRILPSLHNLQSLRALKEVAMGLSLIMLNRLLRRMNNHMPLNTLNTLLLL